ncbi:MULTISPECIES: stage II sporulation protein M [Paenibacillus]|uniref:stage II sporulation protein M n=1 Tax=Paenibacillus TaxID=44249 RepID=UPI0022B8DB7B|nr:stage II sporulation protein M [Paenibacillus caseinilyticus]MCZ8523732.1 stage II sporulation protein M [Paenibacillus caseinilyticus]
MNWKLTWLQAKEMKHYFIASTLVMLVGIYMGAASSERFDNMILGQMEALKDILETTKEAPNQQWSIFWLIFWNNASKSLIIIALGAFLGLPPLFFLVVNGLLIGYISVLVVEKESWTVLIKTIVPHGILELPAVIVACAYGLRLGILVLKWLISIPSPARKGIVSQQFLRYFRTLPVVAVMLVAVLFIAAVIESTLTFWLASGVKIS